MIRTLLPVAVVLSASSLLLVDSAIKGALILVLAAFAAMLLRRDSAATRHLVWLVAIVAMLVIPVLSLMLPQWQVLPAWAAIPRESPAVALPVSVVVPDRVSIQVPSEVSPIESGRPSSTSSQPAAEETISQPAIVPSEVTSKPAEPIWNWIITLPLLWAIGLCGLTLRLIAAQWMLWRHECRATVIGRSRHPADGRTAEKSADPVVATFDEVYRHLGIHQPVRLLICSERTIPVVWGIIRLRLLLPAAARQWSGEQLRSVLLHELAHIKRHDTIVQLLAQLACALHWFNPLVWFAAWRLRVERERACDDLVLANGVRASAYAEHLLNVATKLSPAHWKSACGVAMASKSSLGGRLDAVLSEHLNRRRVSTTCAVIALLLGVSIAIPVAMLHAAQERQTISASAAEDGPRATNEDKGAAATADNDEEESVDELKPDHEDGQALFRIWQASARTDGKIPGALIGRLHAMVRYFISLNKDDKAGHDYAVRFEKLLPRFDASHDWTQAEAVALLNDVAAIHPIPLRNTLDAAAEKVILTGEPLPAELTDAPWGKPAPNGLRVAWHLEPRAQAYPLGTLLRSRILVHNSGKEPVFFIMPSWQQSSKHTAHDADGAAIQVSSVYWTTMARLKIYRLAPGAYCETPAPGIGVGARTDDEDWANIRPGAWVEAKEGDDVRLTPGAVEVRFSPSVVGTRIVDGRPENTDPKDAADLWKRIVDERIDRETPIPTGAADREQLLRRVVLDLFGKQPEQREIAAFVADKSPATRHPIASRDLFRIRVLHKRSVSPFTGTLPPGDLRFRVLAADSDATTRPRVATAPGYYILGDNERFHIEQVRKGNQRTNKATIRFFASKPKTDPPGKPYEIALPDGLLTYAVAWDRSAGALWIAQKGLVRKYDFTNPAQVKETRFGPGSITNVPERFREALRAALDVPGAPVQQQEQKQLRDA